MQKNKNYFQFNCSTEMLIVDNSIISHRIDLNAVEQLRIVLN